MARTKQVIVLVTEAERQWLRREAGRVGLSVGAYLRARAGLKTTSPLEMAAAYSTFNPDATRVLEVSEALAGLQEGLNNARALLEGRREEG